MTIPSNVRGWLYVLLAVVALVLAATIVVSGVISKDQVLGVLELTVVLYAAFIGALARINLTK